MSSCSSRSISDVTIDGVSNGVQLGFCFHLSSFGLKNQSPLSRSSLISEIFELLNSWVVTGACFSLFFVGVDAAVFGVVLCCLLHVVFVFVVVGAHDELALWRNGCCCGGCGRGGAAGCVLFVVAVVGVVEGFLFMCLCDGKVGWKDRTMKWREKPRNSSSGKVRNGLL